MERLNVVFDAPPVSYPYQQAGISCSTENGLAVKYDWPRNQYGYSYHSLTRSMNSSR
jgi:hypothetical protein